MGDEEKNHENGKGVFHAGKIRFGPQAARPVFFFVWRLCLTAGRVKAVQTSHGNIQKACK
jgi:hypothetical protein